MRFCDLTLAYTETSGGIRTYIDHKRRHVAEHIENHDVGIVEQVVLLEELYGLADHVAATAGAGRRPPRLHAHDAVVALVDEVVEAQLLGVKIHGLFVSPWAAFRYREECRAVARPCLVSAYFHTDVAEAYIGAPLRHFLADGVEEISDTLADWGHKVSDAIESGAEASFGQIFQRCDLLARLFPEQAERIRKYGVEAAHIVPLGVDLGLFSPPPRRAASPTPLRIRRW